MLVQHLQQHFYLLISPSTSCATYSNSQSGPQGMTVSGSTLRAADPDSDFALLQINQSIPSSWNRVMLDGIDQVKSQITQLVFIILQVML